MKNTGGLPGRLTNAGQTFRIFVRISGPLLLALADLAIRSRIKR